MTSSNPSRMEGLDLARCLALIGMVLVNFRLAMGVERGEPNWLAHGFDALQGRSAATFVVLAGLGLALGLRKLDATTARYQTLRRSVFLFLVGLLNSLIFPADIIHYYGIYFALGVLLLPLRTGLLVAWIVGIVFAFPLLVWGLDYNQGWNWATLDYQHFWTIPGFLRHLLFNGWHPVVPWLAFLLWGMLLARLALHTVRIQALMVLGGAACALIAHGVSASASTHWPSYASWLGVAPMPPMPLYLIAGAGVATCAIGLCLAVMQHWGQGRALRILLPAGRMTLTLYIAHILLGMGTLEAMGWLKGQGLEQVAIAAGTYCTCAISFAWLWSKRFPHGPLEWLMRRITG